MDERMDAPSGKRIVELLRKAARGGYEGAKNEVMDDLAQLIGCNSGMHFHIIGKLADMVEEAIQREHETAYDNGYDDGFASADDWCAQHEDAMAEHGWYRAVDMYKKPVLIGDMMQGIRSGGWWCEPFKVVRIDFNGHDWVAYEDAMTGHLLSKCRHYRVPTVEDTLHELIGKALTVIEINGENELVAEYAKRLRLAGDAE